MSISKIKRYYNESCSVYNIAVYIHGRYFGNHYGFWEKNTSSLLEANINENKEIIKIGSVGHKSRVLDAGCGVGRSAIYISQMTGATVYGINISDREVLQAKSNAEKLGAKNVHFSIQNYSQTRFPDDYFDVVYGIESVCYAYPKIHFLTEAYRILKPGGKLIISDGYKKSPQTDREKKVIDDFIYGFGLDEMICADEMASELKKAGFVNIKVYSKLKEIHKSVKYFAGVGSVLMVFSALLRNLNRTFLSMYRNGLAAVSAYKGIQMGIADYCIHVGSKK